MKEDNKFHYRDNVSETTSKLIGFILKMSPDERHELYDDLKLKYRGNKRRYPRKPYFSAVECGVEDRFRHGYIKNICPVGLFIEMDAVQKMMVGTPITMTFSHPDSNNHIKTAGEIVRVVENAGIGVQLSNPIPLFN